ncbi:hypothetical protein BACCIP111895_02470 [Neobacillus rhizosphaerae]|uniref:DUF3949 domain-containing protein n=1 Tax=Neobacillus rhizosphaerae TaxID=2880965 RepID=A0ABM9ET46_9BACI|nr:DUF3949 domain-containing protein [Neobacillus rhizosphaerae]CAH2715286.1 hypothetical protein BACCIP111895_02470 [Neobacillus rhizosphaerae]
MELVFIVCLSVYAVYFLIMIPVQYAYISETKERFKELNQSHNEIYDNMSFEEQQLQYNLQGNLLNLPSNIVAAILYKVRNR